MFYKSILVFFMGLFFLINYSNQTFAKDPDETLRKDLKKLGYTSPEKAIKMFERKYNKTVQLPKIPIKANHCYGMVTDKGDLYLQWIDTKAKNSKTFWMNVKVANVNKRSPLLKGDEEYIKLNDNISGHYSFKNFHRLLFNKDGLEYYYMHDNSITKQEFITIAKNL